MSKSNFIGPNRSKSKKWARRRSKAFDKALKRSMEKGVIGSYVSCRFICG